MLNCPLKSVASPQTAWIDSDRVFSFQELDEWADCWAAVLLKQGIQEGGRVAVAAPLSPLLAALFFGAWRIGAAVCPLNLRLPPRGVEEYLKRLNPALFLGRLEPPPRTEEQFPTIEEKRPALFLMTSGSTGEPKIAVLTLAQLLANARAAVHRFDLREKDRWLLTLPLFHVGGIGLLLRSILARAAVVTDPRYPAVTHLSAVPTQLYRASPVYPTLRCLLLGGAPIHFISASTKLPLIASYGLTEMGSVVLAVERPIDRFLGWPLEGRKIKLEKDGEIWVGGECLFEGYWRDGAIASPGEWFPTGDLGEFCPKRGYSLIGRKDWQFISGGENIQPEEIERHLLEIQGVKEAAVLPRPDPEFGARPIAFISGSLDIDRMRKELREKLPKYKIPDALFLLDELPKKGLKIDRRQLGELQLKEANSDDKLP